MDSLSIESQVQALREEVGRLRGELARGRERRGLRAGRLFWPLLAGLLAFTATSAAQLVTFSGGQPALASEINANFAQLQTWIEQKVGAVGSAPISTETIRIPTNLGSLTIRDDDGEAIVQVTEAGENALVSLLDNASLEVPAAVSAASASVSGEVSAGSLSVSGATATGSLSVTSGLPITVEEYPEGYMANGLPEDVVDIAEDDGRRACFLAGMDVHDTFADESQARCFVETTGSMWQLRIDVDNGGGDPDVTCRVRCISW